MSHLIALRCVASYRPPTDGPRGQMFLLLCADVKSRREQLTGGQSDPTLMTPEVRTSR